MKTAAESVGDGANITTSSPADSTVSSSPSGAIAPLVALPRGRPHAYLKDRHVPHVWHVTEHAHDAAEWKQALYSFLQKLTFAQDTKTTAAPAAAAE